MRQKKELNEVSDKMAMIESSRVVCLIVCFLIRVHLSEAEFTIPDVVLTPLWPKGLRVSMPEIPNVSLFAFQANINRSIGVNDMGSVTGEITKPKDGKFTFEDPGLQLKPGDIINYYLYVIQDQKGYVKDNLSYTVTVLKGSPTGPRENCQPTSSLVRGEKVCRGDILFEDNFDSLREDLWQIEQYIPQEPDFPFISYQRQLTAPTVSVKEGYLIIEPKLLQDLPGYTNDSIFMGTLDLYRGCTAMSSKCRVEAFGARILPPIASGKLTTKAFAFTYGVVEVRAKLPQGDWLYPDILLEPFFQMYGSENYASGILRIAGALGNVQLSDGGKEVGNKVLYGGPIIDFQCRKNLLSRKMSDKPWGDDFHVYSVRWEPEKVTLFVDGEEWARIEPAASGLVGRLRAMAGTEGVCDTTRIAGASDNIMAPFDNFFYLSLGVKVGGITEFKDSLTSQGVPKPWQDNSSKASIRFWQDRSSWFPTWTHPNLVVDYVRVKAL